MYRLNVYRGNPRDGYYFYQQNNDKSKLVPRARVTLRSAGLG